MTSRRKLRRLRDRRLEVRDRGWQITALAQKRAALEIFVVGFGIDRRARRDRSGNA